MEATKGIYKAVVTDHDGASFPLRKWLTTAEKAHELFTRTITSEWYGLRLTLIDPTGKSIRWAEEV